jgi:hypothetical protein
MNKIGLLLMGKHSQIEHVLIDKRRNSNTPDVRYSEELAVILTIIWWLKNLDDDDDDDVDINRT